jgi:hypothetical protein
MQAKEIFSANDNKISSGRITSGYSFRQDVAPDPQKVSIHSKISFNTNKQSESHVTSRHTMIFLLNGGNRSDLSAQGGNRSVTSHHVTTHNDLPAER